MFELNAPHSPLSAVMIDEPLAAARPAHEQRMAVVPHPADEAASSSAIFSAYGRAAMMRSWARRSFAAATSFIAR